MVRFPAAALGLLVWISLTVACAGGETSIPTPEGLTVLSISKTMVETGDGQFEFTLKMANEGDYAAINVVTSDVMQEGLEVIEIGPAGGVEVRPISDRGIEFIFRRFEAGESVDVAYTARCRDSGKFLNKAVVSSANSESQEAVLELVCP